MNAYEIETHAAISRAAANASILGAPGFLSSLGLRPLTIDGTQQTFINSLRERRSISALIQFGARWEDDKAWEQALRHFYDPVNSKPLDLDGLGAPYIVASPDWALEDTEEYSDQANSYRDARHHFYDALTGLSDVQRRKSFGLMFQSIGHVIHHLQDMAQPQHVRNDVHCDKGICKTLYPHVFAPSQYEKYTDLDSLTDPRLQIRRNLPFDGPASSAVYPGANAATVPFKKSRDFWRTTAPGSPITDGKGVAEYTNRNFYSARTIELSYNSPGPRSFTEWFTNNERIDIRLLLPDTSLRGTVRFFESPVSDALSGEITTNAFALSEAVLDSDLAQIYSTTNTNGYLVYAMNRFTYDAAHQFLIPRAVGYSAGLINYFFRGQLDVQQPYEGAYAILDHAVENQRNGGGFRKLKVLLRNMTPGGTDASGNVLIEPIAEGSGGELRAIVKFHRNGCYQPDLSGEYGSPGMNWRFCRSPTEEIVVSGPHAIPDKINEALQPVVFDFASQPIPIDATDVYLQVVYRGPLGEEADAIVVATRDISEPTYNYTFTMWDQNLYCANGVISRDPPCAQVYTFEQSFCQQAAPELTLTQCRARNGRTTKVRGSPIGSPLPGFDPENPDVPPGELIYDPSREPPLDPLFALPTPVGSFTRVAVLTDVNPSDPYVIVDEQGVADQVIGFSWYPGQGAPTINQLDPVTDVMTVNRNYAMARGVFVSTEPYEWNPMLSDFVLLSGGSAPNIPPLNVVPSQIMVFADMP
ncbi:MAG TPA: hypothetical protein VJP86_08325 [Vicinamibacterales bacterium]|nr:hypothetical protein [Vicinamibacterales bacterium]